MSTLFTRRDSMRSAIAALLMLGGCKANGSGGDREGWTPPRGENDVDDGVVVFEDAVDAAFDTILPAERDASGKLIEPGAREAGASRVLASEGFGLYALAQGFVPPTSERFLSLLKQAGPAVRVALNVELDALAAVRRPLVGFRDLSLELREAVLDAAFDDPVHAGSLLLIRAACFTAYLGAVTSDMGLRAVGFPPFEDFDSGLAVSGYPRTKDGRLVDASGEDLGALAAKGQLDDYTYDRRPPATAGDDLSQVIDAEGDLT